MAGSDGSITPSVGSVPHQASGSSSPCSHSSSGGSRHPVSALKKWLTNPVRKLSSDARGGAGKVEKQMCRSDGRQPPLLLSHSEAQQRPLEPHGNYNILPSGDTVSYKDLSVCISSSWGNTFNLLVSNGCLFLYCTGVERQSVRSSSFFPYTAVLSEPLIWPPARQRHTESSNGSILFYSILFYSILFYSILFYSILFYTVVSCSALFYSVLFMHTHLSCYTCEAPQWHNVFTNGEP